VYRTRPAAPNRRPLATALPRTARGAAAAKALLAFSTMEAIDPLIRRAQEGDEAAFREIFLRHRAEVARVVQRVMGPSPDGDDVVQDVFVHVFRSLRSFRGESKFTTWLFRLTVNVTRMHLRRGRARPRIADVDVPETAGDDDAPQVLPDRAYESDQRLRALYRLLDALGEKKRTVLVLHDLEGMPSKEIAELVGAPVLTVRTRLFYARKELYAAIAKEPALAPLLAELGGDVRGRPEGAAEAGDTDGTAPARRTRDTGVSRARARSGAYEPEGLDSSEDEPDEFENEARNEGEPT
jgi:RNA polymerase sigma-70 factor (ECF subfamily)